MSRTPNRMVRTISQGRPPSRLFPVVAAFDRDANHALTTECAKARPSPEILLAPGPALSFLASMIAREPHVTQG
jgi:hypothetical protein